MKVSIHTAGVHTVKYEKHYYQSGGVFHILFFYENLVSTAYEIVRKCKRLNITRILGLLCYLCCRLCDT